MSVNLTFASSSIFPAMDPVKAVFACVKHDFGASLEFVGCELFKYGVYEGIRQGNVNVQRLWRVYLEKAFEFDTSLRPLLKQKTLRLDRSARNQGASPIPHLSIGQLTPN